MEAASVGGAVVMPRRAAIASWSQATSSVWCSRAAWRARAAATVLVPCPPRAPLILMVRVDTCGTSLNVGLDAI